MNKSIGIGVIAFFLVLQPKEALCQGSTRLFYLVDKGIYIEADKSDLKTKVPYKENYNINLEILSDTSALVQEVKNGILVNEKKYKIGSSIDTLFVRRNALVQGKRRLTVVKLLYRKIYALD